MVKQLAKFTTNGMFILDDIQMPDGKLYQNIIGGAGTYTILGSLIVASGLSKWIADKGTDLPESYITKISQWHPQATVWRDHSDRLTTHGFNYYANGTGLRIFKYLTPKIQINVDDWIDLYGIDQVKAFSVIHIVASMERTSKIIDDLATVRLMKDLTIVWEPVPQCCKFENLCQLEQIIKNCSSRLVLSPNLEESIRLLNWHQKEDEIGKLDECIPIISKFISILKVEDACIIRCGALGSITLTPTDRNIIQTPAYYQDEPQKVSDATGGGNSFLGGLSMGLVLKPNDWRMANIYGHIASSFCIEQQGIPSFHNGVCNDSTFDERLEIYEKKKQTILLEISS